MGYCNSDNSHAIIDTGIGRYELVEDDWTLVENALRSYAWQLEEMRQQFAIQHMDDLADKCGIDAVECRTLHDLICQR